MTLDEIADAEWFLQHNPPLYALVGDYLQARKTPQTIEAGSKEELKAFAQQWRNGM